MGNPEANALIQAVGALTEMTALYFNELRKNGVPLKAAVELTRQYTALTLQSGSNDQSE